MALGLIASAVWYSWLLHTGDVSLGGAVMRILVVTFVATGAGKIFGILRHRSWEQQLRKKTGMAGQA